MNAFLQLPAERRRLAFQQVDEAMGLQAFSVEKDFWVCWTLRELFTLPGIGEHLTFKGGTSLSKAWKLIRRFSEDIDLIESDVRGVRHKFLIFNLANQAFESGKSTNLLRILTQWVWRSCRGVIAMKR